MAEWKKENAAEAAAISGSVETEVGQRSAKVGMIGQGMKDLKDWAAASGDEVGMQGQRFLSELHTLEGQVGGMLLSVERGSKEERMLLQSRAVMNEKLIATTLKGATDSIKNEVRAIQKSLEEDMLAVANRKDLSREEMMLELERLREDANRRIGQTMTKQEEFGPAVAAYRAEVDEARRRDLEFEQDAVGDAQGLTGAEKKAAREAQAQAAENTRQTLLSVISATSAAEALQEDLKSATSVLDKNGEGAMNAAEMMITEIMSSAEGAFPHAQAAASAALALADAMQGKSGNLLGRISTVVQDAQEEENRQVDLLTLGMQAEQHRAKNAVLRISQARARAMGDLGLALDDAHSTGNSAFQARIDEAGRLHGLLEGELHNLADQGHAHLATLINDTVKFMTEERQALLKMKLTMYDNYKLQAQHASSSFELMRALRTARSNMMLATRTVDALSSTMQQAILDALAQAGITGREAAHQLAMYMNKVQFDIMAGQHDGFDALLEDMYKEFGSAVDFGDLVGDQVGRWAGRLTATQSGLDKSLGMLKEMFGEHEDKYEQYKAAILATLGKEYELSQVTDEDLRSHLLKMKKILAVLAVKNHPLPTAATTFLEEGDLASLEARAQRVHARHLAATAERDRLTSEVLAEAAIAQHRAHAAW
jgi:hypothetical protein